MHQQELINKIKSALRQDYLRKLAPAGSKVFLFGSRADNTAQSRSDFDIGVDCPEEAHTKFFHAVEDILGEMPTLLEFDLVDFTKVSPQFKSEALKYGVEILHEYK